METQPDFRQVLVRSMMFIVTNPGSLRLSAPKPFQSARACLAHSAAARRIRSEIDRQQALLARIRSYLPARVAAHCTTSILNGETLSLYTESPVWASRLRYLQGELATSLAGEGINIREVRVRISMPNSTANPRRHRHRQDLSAENATLLRSVAEATNDPGLKQALQRLSTHARG